MLEAIDLFSKFFMRIFLIIYLLRIYTMVSYLFRRAKVAAIILTINGTPRSEYEMLQLIDTGSQVYGFKELDGAGQASSQAPDSAPVWSVSDESILKVVPSDDGMTATVSAVGPLGSAMVQVSMSFAGQPMSGSDTVSVINSPVASIVLAPVV